MDAAPFNRVIRVGFVLFDHIVDTVVTKFIFKLYYHIVSVKTHK